MSTFLVSGLCRNLLALRHVRSESIFTKTGSFKQDREFFKENKARRVNLRLEYTWEDFDVKPFPRQFENELNALWQARPKIWVLVQPVGNINTITAWYRCHAENVFFPTKAANGTLVCDVQNDEQLSTVINRCSDDGGWDASRCIEWFERWSEASNAVRLSKIVANDFHAAGLVH